MRNITTIGVDLAKNIFQVHGVDERGKVVLRRALWTAPREHAAPPTSATSSQRATYAATQLQASWAADAAATPPGTVPPGMVPGTALAQQAPAASPAINAAPSPHLPAAALGPPPGPVVVAPPPPAGPLT